jgi:hypothetical protein
MGGRMSTDEAVQLRLSVSQAAVQFSRPALRAVAQLVIAAISFFTMARTVSVN